MHVVSQIIERNLHRREVCESGLWINPDKNCSWSLAQKNCPSLKLFSQDFGSYSSLHKENADIEFGAFPQTSDGQYDWIIINLPRQKALLKMLLECAAGLLGNGGKLWLAGENKAGIKSADKLLKLHFGRVRKLDNARHCTLYEASHVLQKTAFNPSNYRQEWTIDSQQCAINIVSYPGVFAHGRIDAGTALLLESLMKMEIYGDVLDFACGAGILGASIAAKHPQTNVTFLDTSALALRASSETLAANQLKGTLLASDGLSKLEGSFDFVVSNPPIHAGIKTDSHMGMQLLDYVHEHIRPGGTLIMVANVHLPYENWLAQKFKIYQERVSNNNYKVILAKR
jgi:16S rRNA (guanine1207-N2)-methyltransferase